MTATITPRAGLDRDGRPVLHEAVEAMLATARRLALEANISPPAPFPVKQTLLQVEITPVGGDGANASAAERETHLLVSERDEDPWTHPARAICYAAGAGVLFSLLLRRS